MAKSSKAQQNSGSRHVKQSPYPLLSRTVKVLNGPKKKHTTVIPIKARKEWDGAICSVCQEFPHNAVLLLCSSYENGCRPYMCATSHRYSNCLEQYKKACSAQPWLESTDECTELLCPLCRGKVKGWTVVEDARKHLNLKKRTCTHDACGYVGTYKELRRHVKAEHPLVRPRDVDPELEEKWKRLEHEREREDVMSTIHSSMPGAVVMGDYVIEGNISRLFAGINLDGLFDNRGVSRAEPSGSRSSFLRGFRRRAHRLDLETGVLRHSVAASRRVVVVPRRTVGRGRSRESGELLLLDEVD